MLCITLTKSGPVVGLGTPKFFLEDAAVVEVLNCPAVADSLVEELGQGATVGRLGLLGEDHVYYEREPISFECNENSKESLGFYEKL